MNSTQGFVYIATGEEYLTEAQISVQSLKSRMDDPHVTLYTDKQTDIQYFDDIRVLDDKRNDFGDSILQPDMIPYERTVFLDSDTFITESIIEVFDLLDRFDLAATHNPGNRTLPQEWGQPARNVPDSFPLYNTGVLALKASDRIDEFLTNWRSIYEDHVNISGNTLNQPAFREALYHSDLRIATLPSEYNCRIRYNSCAGFLSSNAKIVHGRHPAGLSEVAESLNETSDMRVFSFKEYPVRVETGTPSLRFYLRALLAEGDEHYTYQRQFKESIEERGVKGTVVRALKRLKPV